MHRITQSNYGYLLHLILRVNKVRRSNLALLTLRTTIELKVHNTITFGKKQHKLLLQKLTLKHNAVVIILENGWYGQAPIRSDTIIRVYTMADTNTDTSTPCVMVS